MKQKKLKKKLDLSRFTIPSDKKSKQTDVAEHMSFTINPETTTSTQEGIFWETKTGKAWIIGFICLLLFSFVGCILILRVGTQNKIPIISEKIVPSAWPTVSPSPIPKIVNKSAYKIKVLNGSGIKGEAAKTKKTLEEEGFVVSTIGNAPESSYQKSTIGTKKHVDNEFISEMKATLSSYVFSNENTELSESEDVDVVIIIGPKQ